VTLPIPTTRAVGFAAVALLPAVLAVAFPPLAWLALALDVALVGLAAIDFLRAPRAASLLITREVAPVLSSGVPNRVRLVLEQRPGATGEVRGEVKDSPPPGPEAHGHRQRLGFTGRTTLEWRLVPKTRGDLVLGDAWLRLEGPLGLCARQERVPLTQAVKVFPDLTALTQDAVKLARASDDASRRVVRVRAEGREFESLREYRVGDDRRAIDWKATARRGKAMVRQHQPERNQQVLLLLDCGRHMAGEVLGRRKLDHAVDAALRLAKVSLDKGDLVGVLAFAAEVKVFLPPKKGAEQLFAITQALYRVEASLEESDYGLALDRAFARGVRRTLVVVMTDLLDAESSQALVKRTLKLVPRHLPLVASLLDDEVRQAATLVPATKAQAYERQVAARLEGEVRATVARLRDAGAQVLRAPARDFGPSAVNAYLEVKARGLL
jgi:uncharacterized protein (DUF58 family)